MSKPERRAREQAARRISILEAAKAVFAEKEFARTRIDDIAERAELGKGTIYLYFKAKEEIYFALIDVGLAILAKRFADAVDPSLPADENLVRVSSAYYRFYREEPQYFKLLAFGAQMDAQMRASADPSQRQSLACMRIVESIIQKGIDEGVFMASVGASEAAAIAWASATGLILAFDRASGHTHALDFDMEKLLRTQIEIFIYGLKEYRERTCSANARTGS